VKKTAWIFSGGAARTVYVAGGIYALAKSNLPKPDIIIAGSGSAGTSLCYITGQHEVIKKVWCEDLFTRKFINFWRFWKIVDIDYLIDTILYNNNPLNIDAIKNSDIEIYFPATDSKTGKIKYFHNHDIEDMAQVLKAVKSSPFFTNLFSIKGKKIDNKYYSDSIISSRYQFHIKKALAEGAERIIVLDSYHHNDKYNKYFFSKLYARIRNKEFKKNQLTYIKEIENFTKPYNIEFIKISPRKKLGISLFGASKEEGIKIFNKGYKETIKKLKKSL